VTATNIYQCAYDRSDHIPEEPIGDGDDRQHIIDLSHFETPQVANVARCLRIAVGEGGEIVPATKQSGSLSHPCRVEGAPEVVDVPVLERACNRAGANPIFVRLLSGRVTGMKRLINQFDCRNPDIRVEVSIDCITQPPGFKLALHQETRNLALSVHSRIGAACAMNSHIPMVQERENTSQLALYSSAARLYLPSLVIGAVVFEDDLYVLQIAKLAVFLELNGWQPCCPALQRAHPGGIRGNLPVRMQAHRA